MASKPGKFVLGEPTDKELVAAAHALAGPAPVPELQQLLPLVAKGPLPVYFSCLDNGSSQTLRCRKCGKGYKVPSGSVHPGNRIALMNHIRTHSELEEL